MKQSEYFTYDDIQIVPRYSEIPSRQKVSLKTRLTKNYVIDVPIISAPMQTVTGYEMIAKLAELNAIGALHRFMDIDEMTRIIKLFKNNYKGKPICVSVGVRDEERERIDECIKNKVNILLIDVAHGHHKNVADTISYIRSRTGSVDIIAGNVATREGAEFLAKNGVDGIRVGVGGGSVCSTRVVTGIGVPQASAIHECYLGVEDSKIDVPIIADGGIRIIGDIAKALALGADTVMVGKLFAQTHEAPGELLNIEGKTFKTYYGSASIYNKKPNIGYIEGESAILEVNKSVGDIVRSIKEGLQSTLSYVGVSTIPKFHSNVEVIRVTGASRIEAMPHATINFS